MIHNDAPTSKQILFQDPATEAAEGIIELHSDILFFLILISTLVLWLLFQSLHIFSVNRLYFERLALMSRWSYASLKSFIFLGLVDVTKSSKRNQEFPIYPRIIIDIPISTTFKKTYQLYPVLVLIFGLFFTIYIYCRFIIMKLARFTLISSVIIMVMITTQKTYDEKRISNFNNDELLKNMYSEKDWLSFILFKIGYPHLVQNPTNIKVNTSYDELLYKAQSCAYFYSILCMMSNIDGGFLDHVSISKREQHLSNNQHAIPKIYNPYLYYSCIYETFFFPRDDKDNYNIDDFRKNKTINGLFLKPEPTNMSHNSKLEVIWTIIPAFILAFTAIPSYALIYAMDELITPTITLKAIGHQWYWSYEFSDKINFESYIIPEADLIDGQLRLLEVDTPIILPTDFPVRILITSEDVLHSWTIPSFGIKLDGCPGRLNLTSTTILRNGHFYGQCSELCGINHAFMPIVCEATSIDEFIKKYPELFNE